MQTKNGEIHPARHSMHRFFIRWLIAVQEQAMYMCSVP